MTLSLNSTLAELPLHQFKVEFDIPGRVISEQFKLNPGLPGVILTEQNQFFGMISRQRFWERMGRPYSLELFSKRSIKELYKFVQVDHLVLTGSTSIVGAAQQALVRPSELLYEPIVVHMAPHSYRLIDIHQLLLAQSKIHELATQLLQQQTEAKLVQTEKMAALGQMVASVAHEILNPVNFISGNMNHVAAYSQDLFNVIAAYDADEVQSVQANELRNEIDFEFITRDFPQVINSIKMGAERLKKTVGALKRFSHIEETQQKSIDLHACLDDTLLILHGRLKHQIEVVKQYGELPLVRGSSGQMSQVFMNLVGNAIDALLEQLSTQERSDWQPQITLITGTIPTEPDWVSIQIVDNGPGMTPEVQARVFEAFFTTKPAGVGTGLGLAISHQIVTEKHGGRLMVRSQPGLGTTFEVQLAIGELEKKTDQLTNCNGHIVETNTKTVVTERSLELSRQSPSNRLSPECESVSG